MENTWPYKSYQREKQAPSIQLQNVDHSVLTLMSSYEEEIP